MKTFFQYTRAEFEALEPTMQAVLIAKAFDFKLENYKEAHPDLYTVAANKETDLAVKFFISGDVPVGIQTISKEEVLAIHRKQSAILTCRSFNSAPLVDRIGAAKYHNSNAVHEIPPPGLKVSKTAPVYIRFPGLGFVLKFKSNEIGKIYWSKMLLEEDADKEIEVQKIGRQAIMYNSQKN